MGLHIQCQGLSNLKSNKTNVQYKNNLTKGECMWYGKETGLTLHPHTWVPYHMALTNQLSINKRTIYCMAH